MRRARIISPQLANLKPQPPSGADWIHEIRLDGYRSQAHVSADGTRIFTRSGLNWTRRFTAIAAELAGIGGSVIIDGEIVVVVDERTDFGALQADLAAGRQERRMFYALDLLYLDGYDMRRVRLIERKRLLKELLDRAGLQAPVLFSGHMDDGAAMFAGARKLNWEASSRSAPTRHTDRIAGRRSRPRCASGSR